jgi:hypothetical protein
MAGIHGSRVAIGRSAKPRQIIPGAAFHHHSLPLIDQRTGELKHITNHILNAIDTAAEGKGTY